MTMCSHIAVMNEGEIIQQDTPSLLYEYPTNRVVAEFFGQVNIFEGTLVTDERDHCVFAASQLNNRLHIPYAIGGREGMKMEIALRPEKVYMSKSRPPQTFNWEKGEVDEIAYFGSSSMYHVRLSGGFVLLCFAANASKQHETEFTWEAEVFVYWNGENCVVMGRDARA